MNHTKTALVTGSTSGIGLAVAKALACEGFRTVVHGSRDALKAGRIIEEIRKDSHADIRYMQADLKNPASIYRMIETCCEIDILVNNAGIQHVAPVDEFPAEKWDDIIAVNLSAAFHATKAVLPQMKRKGWGRIVNIASAHGIVASPFKSAYIAAKHGLVGFTKTVALETAKTGITCNAICPGYVMTPLVEKQLDDQAKARGIDRRQVYGLLLETQPTGRFVQPSEIGALTVFLATDAAMSVTGAALPVDGGWTSQ